jgi:hypothetical protein
MTYKECDICNEWDWTEKHICPPMWEIGREWEIEDDECFDTIYAKSAEEAVLKYAEINFSNWEYPEQIEIWVRQVLGNWEKFEVYVESVPSFSACKIEERYVN